MGSRGMFEASGRRGIHIEHQLYDVVETIHGIKVIRILSVENNPSPMFSNTPDTIYFSFSDKNNQIERILYYKGHTLHKSVDFKLNEIPHVHYWNINGFARKSHDKKNIHPLTAQDEFLMEKAIKYNKTINKQWQAKY